MQNQDYDRESIKLSKQYETRLDRRRKIRKFYIDSQFDWENDHG